VLRKFLERLRGSSRASDDLAVGTKRPGDFVEAPDVAPTGRDEGDQASEEAMDAAIRQKRETQT
jgi:hypothetical protein